MLLKILNLFVVLALPVAALSASVQHATESATKVAAQADDISGMYSFLGEGEFLQINMEKEGISGYISRLGDQESDRGTFLDQFFAKGAVQGHEVTFTTKQLHGVWFEFKGRYERGPGKSKGQDGYYILRGTLKEIVTDASNTPSSRSREVEFKLLAQPEDMGISDAQPKKQKK